MSWSLKRIREIEEQAAGWTDRQRTQRKYWAANRQQMCRQKQTDSRQPDDKGHIDLITAHCFPALCSVCSLAGKGCFFLSWCLTHCGRMPLRAALPKHLTSPRAGNNEREDLLSKDEVFLQRKPKSEEGIETKRVDIYKWRGGDEEES